ncbi:MAG: hypothetical protein ACYC91_19195 [Solirubrobacteraceae bacterium]
MQELPISEPDFDTETLALLYDGEANGDMVDSWLRQCLPRVSSDRIGGHRRKFNATMQEPRAGGIPYVALASRNAFLGIQGTLAMFEAAAQSRDFDATVRPAAATLRRVLDFNTEAFGGEIPEFGEATWLYQLTATVSMAENPLSCPLPQFVGTDSSPQETMMMVRMGKWMRESGLDETAAAQELTRRMNAGEPLPWDQQAS